LSVVIEYRQPIRSAITVAGMVGHSANNSRRAISLIGTPSARCNRRISAQSSTEITLPASARGSIPIRR
jgi:hypothetical protein